MNNQLKHIFDESVCLTKRQLKDYTSGQMSREECHAVELHLNSCPLCSMAVEGLSEHPQESVAVLTTLNNGFIQEHFRQSMPQVHLNSIAHAAAPAATMPHTKSKKHAQPMWRNASIAAVLVIFCGLAWFWESGKNKKNDLLAQKAGMASPDATSTEQEKPVASTEATQQEPKGHKNGNSQKPLLIATTRTHDTKETEKAKATEDTKEIDEATVIAAENERASRQKAEPATESGAMSAAKDRNTSDDAAPKAAKMTTMAAAPKERIGVDALEVADAAYEKKYYNAALDQYKEAMKNPDAGRRYKATIGAARCYLALGQKKAAKELLEQILSDKHADREPAQSLLKETE